MTNTPLLLPKGEPKEVSAAASLIPYRRSDERAKYLSWLCCGFSDEEALYVLGLTMSWLEDARLDSKFTDLEERLPEFRKELSREYVELDFQRNFRMVLEKDRRVIRTSLGMEQVWDEESGQMVPAELSSFDQQYLLRLRSAYTPQQLQLLEVIAGGSDGGFNFAEWVSKNQEIVQKGVVQISRTDTISVSGGKIG